MPEAAQSVLPPSGSAARARNDAECSISTASHVQTSALPIREVRTTPPALDAPYDASPWPEVTPRLVGRMAAFGPLRADLGQGRDSESAHLQARSGATG